jgi:aromatic-L-amino-acid decarboxylase
MCSQISSPACTELEVAMMDWLGKVVQLPQEFLNCSDGPGGGVIQVLCLAARLIDANVTHNILDFQKLVSRNNVITFIQTLIKGFNTHKIWCLACVFFSLFAEEDTCFKITGETNKLIFKTTCTISNNNCCGNNNYFTVKVHETYCFKCQYKQNKFKQYFNHSRFLS